tara:strand:- start:3732 stop:4124 length:393 start_codon:yes stop_codon:yes gene_type:complete
MSEITVKRDRVVSRSFRASEFRCRCRRPDCDAVSIDKDFLVKLQALRDAWGLPFIITSGVRCAFWNTTIKGSTHSQHISGKAADIHLETPEHGPKIAALAEKIGMGGIGVGRVLIHVDSGPDGRRWTYDY